MDGTYGEFQGTELDPSFDLDSDDESNDLLPIIGLSALLAAVAGGILVLLGRVLHKPTPQERAQDILEGVGKQGKKGAKTARQVVEGMNLSDLLDEARGRAKEAGSAIGDKARQAGLADLLDQAISKVADATDNLDLEDKVSAVRKRARHADLASLLDEARSKAEDAASRADLRKRAQEAGKRVGDVAASVRESGLDTRGVEDRLDTLKEKLSELIEALQKDVAPKVAGAIKSDVIPAAQTAAETVARTMKENVVPTAQDAVDKVREDVIPAAQQRAGKLADEYEVGTRARKAAEAAREGAGSFGDMLRAVGMAALEKVIEDLLPAAKKSGAKAVKTAREDIIPAAADTAGEAVTRVKEDVLPRVGEAAAQAPDVLSDLLSMARDKAEQALEKAQPVASDALTFTRHRAGDAAEFTRHRTHDVASEMGGRRNGAGKAVSSARQGVAGAIGGAVGATTYAARETTGILFWLAALGGLILLVFVPDREKQNEIWNNFLQFMGELREMWKDLQGVEYEPEPGETPTV